MPDVWRVARVAYPTVAKGASLRAEGLGLDQHVSVADTVIQKPPDLWGTTTTTTRSVQHINMSGVERNKASQLNAPPESSSGNATGANEKSKVDQLSSEVADLKLELKTVSEALSKAYHRQAELQDDARMLRVELEKERRAKMTIEDDFAKLQTETQDLSENLFSEADKMVIVARRETQAVEKKNAQLLAQLEETRLLLENVQAESCELKKFIQNMNEQEKDRELDARIAEEYGSHEFDIDHSNLSTCGSIDPLESVNGENEPSDQTNMHGDEIEDPSTYWSLSDESQLCSFIRPYILDNTPYYNEFQGFLSHIALVLRMTPGHNTPEALASVMSLKDFKVFKRCLSDEIEPTLRLDTAPGLSWLGRRSVMSAIIDGSVTIEPIVGANEAVGASRPRSVNQARPVATKSPCAFCGEARYDNILHLRLHNLQIGTSNANKRKSLSRSVSRSAEPLSRTQSHDTDEEQYQSGGYSAPVNMNGVASQGSDHQSSTGEDYLTPVNSEGAHSTSSTPAPQIQAVSSGYPLCHFCLNRVRTSCDLVQFIRSLRDRVFKTDDNESKHRAWVEFARLKERMFWARTGGVFAPLNWDKQRAKSGRTRPNSVVPKEAGAVALDTTTRTSKESNRDSIENESPEEQSATMQTSEQKSEDPSSPTSPIGDITSSTHDGDTWVDAEEETAKSPGELNEEETQHEP